MLGRYGIYTIRGPLALGCANPVPTSTSWCNLLLNPHTSFTEKHRHITVTAQESSMASRVSSTEHTNMSHASIKCLIAVPSNMAAHCSSRQHGGTLQFPATWRHIAVPRQHGGTLQFPGNMVAQCSSPATWRHIAVPRQHGGTLQFPGNMMPNNSTFLTTFTHQLQIITLRHQLSPAI